MFSRSEHIAVPLKHIYFDLDFCSGIQSLTVLGIKTVDVIIGSS